MGLVAKHRLHTNDLQPFYMCSIYKVGKAIQYHHGLDAKLFALLQSSIFYIRGARSSAGCTANELLPVDLMSSKAQVSHDNKFGTAWFYMGFFNVIYPFCMSLDHC